MLGRYALLAPYARRYTGRYVVGAVCVVGAVVLRLTVPALLGDGLDDLRHAVEAGEPGSMESHVGTLTWLAIGMAAAACGGALMRTWSRLMILGNSRRVTHDLRADLFTHLTRLPPSFYVRHQTGHVMSRCVNDMQNVQGLTGPVVLYLVETTVLYVVGLVFLFASDPRLALVGIAPFPLFLWLARRLAARIQQQSREAQEQLGAVGAKLDESFGGQRVVRSLALEEYDRRAFDAQAGRYRATMLELASARAMLQPSMAALSALSLLLVLAFGGPRVVSGETSIGSLVSIVFYLGLLAGPTGVLGFVMSSLQRGAAALERIGEIFAMPITIRDAADVRPGALRAGHIAVRDLTIDFPPLLEQPHLSGSLPPGDVEVLRRGRRVLDRVSFEVAPGATLGIVGPTGAGKTTLLRALTRQIEVPPGTVFLDGRDVTEIPLAELRAAVAVVPQESFLFSRSLAENVAFGRPDAPREAIERAVETAQLADDLAQLPNGLDTVVGERGVRLSGGQRQRTALARVVLLDPTILLLDDTLSAVDTETADRILKALRPMMSGRTTIVVAHRVATVQHADEILVLDAGRVVERGRHADLLARGGLYASLWRRQESAA